MSTSDERRSTAARVKRWRQQPHVAARLRRERQSAADARDHAPRGRRPTWRVVELVHPAGEFQGLPAAVVCLRQGQDYKALAGRRGPLGRWLRSLQAAGVEPIVSTRWVPTASLSKVAARMIRNARVLQVVGWCGGRPDFLVYPKRALSAL
jgi:hypothetical protein